MSKLPSVEPHHRLPSSARASVAAELLRRYEAGESIRQLCSDTGYSIGRVRRLLDEAGVSYRGRGGGYRSR